MIDQSKINRLNTLTKRSLKLRESFYDKSLPKDKIKKAISLWIRVLRLIKSEVKTLKNQ